MATGLGASRRQDKTIVGAPPDGYTTSGVNAGPNLVSFPGMPAPAADMNLDATSLWVWGITLGAIAVVLGIHFSFGGHRLL